MLLHYLGKLNIQIFCRYSADTHVPTPTAWLHADPVTAPPSDMLISVSIIEQMRKNETFLMMQKFCEYKSKLSTVKRLMQYRLLDALL